MLKLMTHTPVGHAKVGTKSADKMRSPGQYLWTKCHGICVALQQITTSIQTRAIHSQSGKKLMTVLKLAPQRLAARLLMHKHPHKSHSFLQL
jgi:hypothetical protein